MFKTVFSNLKMMINTSTFSKRLIIFLVYYLTIISTVRGIVQDPQDDTGDNIVIERCIAFPRHTFADVLTEDNDDKGFKIKILSFAEKVSTVQEINETMSSIQLGIKVQILDNKIQLTDSSIPEDSKESSAKLFKNWHDPKTYTLLPDFTFSVFAPYTFHYCRNLFGITSTDYVASFCDSPLRELSNPGASKSIFYLTPDDKFIMKTVQQTEDECFLRMLKKYTTYLTENRESLLPKFSAFFSFECRSIENKLVSMNNLIPSALKMHQKFDLKGSTLGREASSTEKGKKSPTYKDLDFRYELHPRGLFLNPDTRLALLKTLEKDCALLKEYNIMDYSILMGIYNIDHPEETKGDTSLNKLRLAAIARWEKLMADADRKTSIRTSDWTFSDTNNTSLNRGIPAKDVNGNRLLLFVGIIDILQTYRTTKSLERNLKSFKLKITPCVTDTANSISVQPPEFYASRFLKFMTDFVFKPMLSPEDLRKLAQQPIETRPSLNKSNSTMNSFKLIKDCLK